MYGNLCDTWSGVTTFTFTRLNADLQFTAESTTVSPGSTPYFDWRPTPLTVEGQTIPWPELDSTSWTPDSAAAGGDPAEAAQSAAGNGACQGQYLPACRRKIIGSGTFRLSAWVNGKWIAKSVHIQVPSLTLKAEAKSGAAGRTVTFTPEWSDGAAIATASWAWAADSGASATVACTTGAPPCKTAVQENGVMTVTIVRGGVSRTAKVHASVIPCPTGNPILDDSAVRHSFKDLFDRSRPDVPGGTGYTTGDMYSGTKKEHGGFIFQRPDGSYYVREDIVANLTATECHFPINALNYLQYRLSPSDQLVGIVHTHPTAGGDAVYGCPDAVDSTGKVVARYPRWPGDSADGRQPVQAGDQWAAGGGSGGDWGMGAGMVDGFVVNWDGEVWRLPKEAADDYTIRVNNHDFHMFENNILQLCDWK